MIAATPLLHKLAQTHVAVYPSVTGAPRPITFHSLAEFAYALAWMVLLLVSFTGWGQLSAKLLRVRNLPASIMCAVGIATAIFIGGVFNILDAVYSGVIFAMVAAGLLVYFTCRNEPTEQYSWRSFWHKASLSSRLLLVAVVVILAIRVAGTVRPSQFDVSDDSAAYLAFPQKMLDTHHFAADPFSERRVTSSLGGSYFLQDMVLSATSLPHVGMADRAVGLILLAGIVFDLGVAFELSVFQIGLVEFLVYLVPQATFNLTFVVLPISLLLGIVWIIWRMADEQRTDTIRLACLAGMIGGAAVSLKSTYLPAVCFLALVPATLLLLQCKVKPAFLSPLVIGGGTLFVVTFWIVAMKQTSGTYLFPVLGRGFDYTRYGWFHVAPMFPTKRSVAKIFLQGIALLLLAGIEISSKPRTREGNLSVAVLVACAASIVVLNYKSSADSIWRYNFPQFFTAVIVFVISSFAASRKHPSSSSLRFTSYIGVCSIVAMICYYDAAGRNPKPFQQIMNRSRTEDSLFASLSGRSLASDELRKQYRDVEAAIPKQGRSLEEVAYSFLLNYKQRKIFIMDWPGAASPLPGWPFGQDSSAVAQYLTRNGIRYVIFDYRYALQNDAKICTTFLGYYRYSEWVREQMWMNVLADNQLDQFKSNYLSIYDDGSIAVIDLTRPIHSNLVEKPIFSINSGMDTVCSGVAARYFDSSPGAATKPVRRPSPAGTM